MVEELSVESKEIVATDLLSYVVQKGDIYSISKKFDLKVEVLKQKKKCLIIPFPSDKD
jgi:hypothetical protein